MIVFAKGVTNGTVPMGGVIVNSDIYKDLCMAPDWTIEFYHGYTYSGHPLATAAANATLKIYRDENYLSEVMNSVAILKMRFIP